MKETRKKRIKDQNLPEFDEIADAFFDFKLVDGFQLCDALDVWGEPTQVIKILYKGYTFDVKYTEETLEDLKYFYNKTYFEDDEETIDSSKNEGQKGGWAL